MIIFGKWQQVMTASARLVLAAYSFSDRELQSVRKVLEKVRIRPDETPNVPRDKADRKGVGFLIDAAELKPLQERLELKFLSDLEGNLVVVPSHFLRDEPRSGSSLTPYCCRELSLSGDGSDSFQITADNDDEALFKCALLGGQKHWFGAKATKGPCPR